MTQPAQQPTASTSILSKAFLAVSFAATLALAPAPALAQHGGGGGGGGSHGGGGGGGSHSSGGGGGHAASASHAGSHSTSTGGNPANPNGGGHWWNPFHGNNSNNSAPAKGGTTAGPNAAGSTTHFAANNYIWQDPPAHTPQHSTGPSNYYANSIRPGTPTTSSPARGTAANNRFRESGLSSQNRFHHNPIYYYYPYYPYYGFGFGSPFFGFGFGCDPWFGCPPGFGYGVGFGFGGGYGYGGGAYGGTYGYGGGSGYDGDLGYYNDNSDNSLQFNNTMPATADQGQGMTSPQDNTSEWLDAPQNNSQVSNAAPQPYVVIVLRDGSSYAVSDYWLEGGKLHYITSYGGENSVDVNQLDLQRTVNDNATRGIEFTLRPTPGANPPSDQQHPQPAPPADDRPQTSAPNPQ
jgi:hypothetical protein